MANGTATNTTVVSPGLEGVVVAETSLGDVRGSEGFYHYRQYSATELARRRSFEDAWALLLDGELPTRRASEAFGREVAAARALPPGLEGLLPVLAPRAGALEVLRCAVALLGAEEGWGPILGLERARLRDQALRLAAVVPTILAATHRLRAGLAPVRPHPTLGHAANYLYMLTGEEPSSASARAVEQYLVLTIEHGFNASTFTARVIASTGADLAGAIGGALAALSGPLHGGAPSRALEMLENMASREEADAFVRAAVGRNERVMGFGHRVYKTDDPRSLFLRDVADQLGGPQVEVARAVEQTIVDTLAELKPDQRLHTNVEFYAGVVMAACGLDPQLFTPTFAVSRTVGWTAHVLEQAAANRLIRPAARYVGPPPPVSVPAA